MTLKGKESAFNYRCQKCGAKKMISNLAYCPNCGENTPNDIEVIESQNTDTMVKEKSI